MKTIKAIANRNAGAEPWNAITRILAALLAVFALTTSLFAQSLGADGPQTVTRQSPETAAAVLQNAEKTGAQVDATIELPMPLGAITLDYVDTPGQIQSVNIASTTSSWSGVIYSTPSAPITSLAEGLRSYEKLYRSAGPGDPYAFFVVTAFTVRGSASEISRARDSLPSANLVSVSDLSESARAENLKSSSTKMGSATEAPVQEAAKAATASASTAFVPSNAELNIQTLSNFDRRIDVTFSWNSSADLAGLSSDRAALEIQVLFWNHAADAKNNNATYVGALKAWGTDKLNHAYFDTPALNGIGIAGSPDEREVTIGSYDARSDFQAGRQYKVWAITERGALDANFAKLSFQRGIYKPTIKENKGVYAYCLLHGGSDPASCVAGVDTQILTPLNYTGSHYSIVAPTVPSFTFPNQTCSIPPGYPYLGEGVKPSSLTESAAYNQGLKILRFQRSFTINGGRPGVGCPTNFTHQDTAWWPRGGLTQDFDGSQTSKGAGAILLAPDASQAFWIHGAIWARYSSPQMGGPKSVVGEPTGDEQSVTSSRGTKGAYQAFTRGWLYFNGAKNQTYYVVNAIAQKYQSAGLHTSQLGFPTSDEYAWNGGSRSDFEGGYIYWTASGGAVIVLNQPLPTIVRYTWNSVPTANQPFSGIITGTGFVSGGTQVWFCLSGTNSCYQHPPAGVTVTSPTSLNVSNVNLSSGAWQVYVQTATGQSTRSSSFAVQAAPPTIGGYSWSTTPRANQPFGGTITGTGFVTSGTQVWFCVNGTSTCYQHPSAGVIVNSPTSLNVSNVNLGAGTWQIYVQTSAGASARSAAFTVQALAPPPPSPPTISGYSWNTTPRANQLFGGTITGTGFVSGGTQVWFCVNGTSTCYQHPAAGVAVNSSTNLSVNNVNLGSGSWQIYVQTSAGQSARSAAFTVQAAAPTISGFSWNTTPVGTQAFGGTITGTNFISGGTQVFFCVSGTGTCYQHPSAGVSVNGPTSLSVSNVRLSTGSWQIYVQTSAGQSARSAAFTVR